MIGWQMFTKMNHFLCVVIKKIDCNVIENYFCERIHGCENCSAGSYSSAKVIKLSLTKTNNTTMINLESPKLKMCAAMQKVDSQSQTLCDSTEQITQSDCNF